MQAARSRLATRSRSLGLLRLCRFGRLRSSGGRPLRQVDLAPKNCVVFYCQTQRADVPCDRAAGTQLHASTGHDVALYLTLDQHIFSRKVGGKHRVGADCKAALGERCGPVYFQLPLVKSLEGTLLGTLPEI